MLKYTAIVIGEYAAIGKYTAIVEYIAIGEYAAIVEYTAIGEYAAIVEYTAIGEYAKIYSYCNWRICCYWKIQEFLSFTSYIGSF